MAYKTLISAFTPPPNGFIKDRNGKIHAQFPDFRTKERYTEFKNCGFDEMIFAGETKYEGEDYSTSELKMMLDLAEECNLKCIVFDERILGITVKAQHNLIGELFSSTTDLDNFIRECIKEYKQHPAFNGVAIIDEPFYGKKGVIKDITSSFNRVDSSVFVHTCFSPLMPVFGGPLMKEAFGSDEEPFEDYGNYVDAMCIKELGYWGFDSYPFKYWENVPMEKYFIKIMQLVVKKCQKHNLPFHMTLQSYADNIVDEKGEKRILDEADFNWQANLAISFGAKKFYYYTYWRFTTRQVFERPDIAIMDDDGTKIMYDDVQKTNSLIKKLFAELGNYEYVASQFLNAENSNPCNDDVESVDLGLISDYEIDAPVLINKMQSKDSVAYMIFNTRNPHDKVVNRISFSLNLDKEYFDMLIDGEKLKVHNEKQLKYLLKPGEAIWIIV